MYGINMIMTRLIIWVIIVNIFIYDNNWAQSKGSDGSFDQIISKGVSKNLSQDWNWQNLGTPLGNSKIEGILLDPGNEDIWYVSSIDSGLFITRDGGISWEHPLVGRGLDAEGYQIDPNDNNRIFVTIWDKLFISNDKGLTWSNTYTCPEYIRSILISKIDGNIYIGPQTEKNSNPGIYKSSNGGFTFTHLPFGVSTNYIICWDIEEDVKNKIFYVSTELADHPQPYHPPLFRSSDFGATWHVVSNSLEHHSLKLQVDTSNIIIYFQQEGGSLFKSNNNGDDWQHVSSENIMSLYLDNNNVKHLYGGGLFNIGQGGVLFSSNGGERFTNIGLIGNSVTSLALNNNSTKIYAVCYDSGIYTANIPNNPTSFLVVTNTNNEGQGSLRDAIEEANLKSGKDTIKFNIPKSDPNYDVSKGIWVIKPYSSLPSIIDSGLVIDGTSQQKYISEDTNTEGPEIVLDGSIAENYASGLTVQGIETEIYELAINNFGDDGIKFYNTSHGIVSGCYIGTDYSGSTSAGNQNGVSILSNSNYILIGPSNFLEKPNVISGNKQNGIFIFGASKFNTILGNYIGVNKQITDIIPNASNGIFLFDSADHNQIFGNSVGGCYTGISISKANSNCIEYNIIGSSESSNYHIYNLTGIRIINTSKNNSVKENTIRFNHGSGIEISDTNSFYNSISQNSISNNWGLGIDNSLNGNMELPPPIIYSISQNQVQGTAGPNEIIEFFADSSNEGQIFIDSTISDLTGNFSLSFTILPNLPNITATARDILGNTSEFSSPMIPTDLDNAEDNTPLDYALYQNYPNPFNPTTKISWQLPISSNVTLKVFDILGNEIVTLINKLQTPGNYEAIFDAFELASGVYFYRLKTKTFSSVKKMIYLE
jgi:photosystem II stability/assembly factor-like uncharacterized protein